MRVSWTKKEEKDPYPRKSNIDAKAYENQTRTSRTLLGIEVKHVGIDAELPEFKSSFHKLVWH
jgi:hypothetical protein